MQIPVDIQVQMWLQWLFQILSVGIRHDYSTLFFINALILPQFLCVFLKTPCLVAGLEVGKLVVHSVILYDTDIFWTGITNSVGGGGGGGGGGLEEGGERGGVGGGGGEI